MLRSGVATHPGRVRTTNADSALVLDRVFVVADGMGDRTGVLASRLAVATLAGALDDAQANPAIDAVVEGVQRANRAIIGEALARPGRLGMGTTITVLALIDTEGEEALAVLNVGDSRAYRLHDGVFEQLTEDHTLAGQMVRDGRLSTEEAAVHPQRHVLTRALGLDLEVDVDRLTTAPHAGDRYLLCTDGLFGELDELTIADALERFDDADEAARELVGLANEAGGRDNVTVVVVDVIEMSAGPRQPLPPHVGATTRSPPISSHPPETVADLRE